MRDKKANANGGFVLILVLLIVAALMAVAVDFAYGVYVNISGIHNLQTMEQLSVEGSSLIDSSAGVFLQALSQGEIPLDEKEMEIPMDDGTDVYFQAGDENSKFNVNTLVSPNGDLNKDAYDSFKRLLKGLNLDEGLADKIVGWINPEALPSPAAGSGAQSVKNGFLTSTPELRLFIDRASYDTLKNYVTIYGDGLIDINSATAPVLMSLSDEVTPDLAGRIIERRKLEPFKNTGELSQVAGFERLGMDLAPKITVSSSAVGITASAKREGITRVVEGVLDTTGKILYWREY